MIEFVDVHKAFGPKKILRGLNLKVAKGEVFFILGRSGTGKSVTLKHLVGLLRPDQGKVILDGEEIQGANEQRFLEIRRKCGMVFQLPALIDSRTVFENVTFGIRDMPLREKVTLTTKALEDVHLHNLIPVMSERYPPELSYGEQKRLAIARTLIIDPQYVLYDEPTTGLDPISSRYIHTLIQDVSKKLGKTSIVVSHDMRNALATADKIVVMDAGQVVDCGTPESIRQSKHPLTSAFLKEQH